VLATGGGTKDQRIRVWRQNASGLEKLRSVKTTMDPKLGNLHQNENDPTPDPWFGQVSGVIWSDDGKKLAGSHGGKICISERTKAVGAMNGGKGGEATVDKLSVIGAHDGRIISMAGRCGRIATVSAGDQSLKLWDLDEFKQDKMKSQMAALVHGTSMMHIR
jgi:WD40 repeat protein